MKPHNITTMLNLKIIFIVVLLMFTTLSYNHLLSLEKENEQNIRYMVTITDFIIEKTPPGILSATNTNDAPASSDHIDELTRQLQPILDNICVPDHRIKFGFYSNKDKKIIALGSAADRTMLSGLNTEQIDLLEKNTSPKLISEKRSLLWYGAEAMTYVKPVRENGVIVGHAFSSVNQNLVTAILWQKTINTFLGIFIMMLICIIIFREIFIKLKRDLTAFAESIVAGNYDKCRSEFAEFNSVLNYISDQTKKMTGLERLNIIGEMAAGIAHEIRNPMTTVRGLLQFIGNKPEFVKHKDNFALMIDELDRANKIITEFLSLSKNKAFEFKSDNLNSIIDDILPLLQSNVLYHSAVLKLNLQPIPPILLDKNSIRQLILNMVKNGLDAMPKGGTISIDTKCLDGQVLLVITDTGSGIPQEVKEKLGTPFFTTKESGTGLGLAICFRIVQRHSAILKVNSEPGEGTAFTIAFPQPKPIALPSPEANIMIEVNEHA